MQADLDRLEKQYSRTQNRMAEIGGLQAALTGLITDLSGWLLLIFTISLITAGRIDGLYLAVLVLGVLASFEAVNSLPAAAQSLQTSLQAGRRIFSITGRQAEVQPPTQFQPIPADFRLELDQVSFRYPQPRLDSSFQEAGDPLARALPIESRVDSSSPKVPFLLHAVSFQLEPGKRVALVGPNGAGKSTLVNLILGNWQADSGSITLGGQDLWAYPPEQRQGWIGSISQSPYLFDTTLRENLLLGNPEADPEQLKDAIQRAQLDDFIAGLPKGIDTWVGEHGFRLSGGERQRVAIARALLQNAPVLVCDEPTQNLDPLNAELIFRLLLDLTRAKSLLWITHHLASLDSFDEILVMKAGRIVEHGPHAELWQANGLYRRLWDLQQQKVF
jgi:ABC-type multidrug transport system fused ATPase/permease subunit